MDVEKELLRQQLEQMSMNLTERDAVLAAAFAEQDANLNERDATLAKRDATLETERALRMAAEAGVQEVTVGAARIPSSRLVLDSLCRSKVTSTRSPRRSAYRRKSACECPSLTGIVSYTCGQ